MARKLTVFLVAAVPVLMLLGLIRAIALLRRGTGASWRDAIGAFFIWQSTSLVVARASVLALFSKKAAFLRTPKTSERTSWWHALRANWVESVLALLGMAGIAGALTQTSTLSGPLLAGLLLVPTLGLAAAPVNGWAARRAALPDWLRERRNTEYRARAPLLRRRHRGGRRDRRRRGGRARDRADAHRPPHHRTQPRPADPVPSGDNVGPRALSDPDNAADGNLDPHENDACSERHDSDGDRDRDGLRDIADRDRHPALRDRRADDRLAQCRAVAASLRRPLVAAELPLGAADGQGGRR